MKSAITSVLTVAASTLPAYAHDDPVPHTHGLPLWGLALLGLAAGALGVWGTMKCLAYVKANKDG